MGNPEIQYYLNMFGLLWLNVSLDQPFRAPKSLAYLDCCTLLNKLLYLKRYSIFPCNDSSENIPRLSHCKILFWKHADGPEAKVRCDLEQAYLADRRWLWGLLFLDNLQQARRSQRYWGSHLGEPVHPKEVRSGKQGYPSPLCRLRNPNEWICKW